MIVRQSASPLISVIIPTYNRAALLRSSLASLAAQTLPRDRFEVIVVNDGSTDATAEVCNEFHRHLRLHYFLIAKSGNAAAKNLGIFASSAPVLFFFDDDDVATPNLLCEHLKAHARHPEDNVAILGYTHWVPGMTVTPVMEYVIDIGQCLFAYKTLRHHQRLDFTYFWCGRISCKRAFVVAHGVFNQDFRSIIEDIELGYRLAKFNLSIIFDRNAVSYMNRPVDYAGFCARCERVGAALYLFNRLYTDPAVHEYCQLADAAQRWEQERGTITGKVERVREVESLLTSPARVPSEDVLLQELRGLYRLTFSAFRLKGVAEASRLGSNGGLSVGPELRIAVPL